jgi:hypothetical protein
MMTNNIPGPNPSHDVQVLLEKAAKCRRLARDVTDKKSIAAFIKLADDYEKQAAAIVETHMREKRDRDG